ncbi:NADH-quinone oxidoreductase subunit C [Haliangium ochraceum]|uniref:NADH-quinone oxidoreductase subunit C n=1 Tax=Haliangium ochraceum (strain DSM 14365 / JCM 11303 / SMP-2) TaxID=502025 RepID=D0LPX5_HALO1|nr:NADH-quinone oxidoreductase subunit C [Haliangium ochraceum]ACY17012.1 NADH (or F420H2) dehydrogenase, subunit C [Haliangium ochraceum DSM 14365]
MAQKTLDALTKKFGDAIEATSSDCGDEVAVVKREKLVEVAQWLRDDPAMAFDSPVFCTCIDNLGEEPRFEVCYQLRSMKLRHRIRLKVRLAEEDPVCPTLTKLWPGFDWQERETYDMYGIEFKDHHDLRRIYMYEEFVGYPLRKDYPKEKRQPLVRRDDLPST